MKRHGGVSSKAKTWFRSPYWGELWRAKWVMLAMSLATFLLSQFGMLDRFETAGLDTFNILKSPPDPQHVIIVAIDDADYAKLFWSISPLKFAEVQKIIEAIAKGHPKVIGVDLDTASKDFAGLATPPGAPPIIWGRDAIWDQEKKQFTVEAVLGGRDPTRKMDAAAIAQFPLESDGLIRRYRRDFAVAGGGKDPSFPWAVVEAACTDAHMPGCESVNPNEEEPSRGRVLNFAGQRFNFTPLSAGFVLQGAEQPLWGTSSPLKDRVVLLGGTYRAGRDLYVTPVGAMAGVQLMAQAVETELTGGGIRPLNEFVAILLDLISGSILVYITWRFETQPGKTMLISLGALVLFPLVSSFLAFSSLARWFNFVPMVVGVLMDQFYHHAKEYQRLRLAHLEKGHGHAGKQG